MLRSRVKPCYFQISRLGSLVQVARVLHVSSVKNAPIFDWMFGSKGSFPLPKIKTTTTNIHGVELVDDFNWLRHRKSKDVRKYIKQENKYTEACLEDTGFFQRKLIHEMSYWLPLSHELESVPEHLDNYAYYLKSCPNNNKLPVACRRLVQKDGSYGEPEIIFNQNELGLIHDQFSVSNFKLSPSRKLLALNLDTTNSETYSGQIIKVWEGPLVVEDSIPNVVNMEWGNDDDTIYYTTPNNLKRANKLWRHKLKDDVHNDELLYEEKHERYFLDIASTKDREFLTVNSSAKITSEVSLIRHRDGAFVHKPLCPRDIGTEYYVEHRDDEFFIITNEHGRNYRVVRVDQSNPSKENWQDLLPPQPKVFIDDMELFANHCVVYERDSTVPRLSIAHLDNPNDVRLVQLPNAVTLLQPGSNQMFKSEVVRYTISSPVIPPKVIDYNMRDDSQIELKPVLSKRPTFLSEDYECTRLEVTSKDGTNIPVTIFHHKCVSKSGRNPMLLHVYGSYGVNVNMGFTPEQLCLLTRGWVLAFCHVRGGGELGREWYHQARLHHKHRTFEDFEACTKSLQSMGYSSPPLTAARGVSAGGLVIGAVCNRVPELFKAVIMKVPFVDILTTMLDPSLPLTAQEYDEWGDPRSSELDFDYIKSYCPYYNIDHKRYPSMLVSGSIFDERVPYWVPLKYVAKMRLLHSYSQESLDTSPHASASRGVDDPMILCSIDEESGHFGSGHTQDSFEEMAEEYAFLHKALGLPLQ